MQYENIFFDLLKILIGAIIGFWLSNKKDKSSYRRQKRSEMYKPSIEKIKKIRDLIDIELQRMKMKYVNFIENKYKSEALSAENMNEIIRLNYKISENINDNGVLFGIKDYKVNQITSIHSSLVNLEFAIHTLLKTENPDYEKIAQIDNLLNSIETEWGELRVYLINIYKKMQNQYQKDIK